MLSLRGAPALSEFRAQKLSEKVSLVIGRSLQIYAEFMHFVQLDEELTEQQKSTLNQILRYGPAIPSHEPNGQLFLVVPRPGTISPWSSKATDIAHNCGLDVINRVERGIAYYIEGAELSEQETATVLSFIHDRMTERVLSEFDQASQLLSRHHRLSYVALM